MAHSSFLALHNGKAVLILILSKESLARIERHDPLIHTGEVVANQIRRSLPRLDEKQADLFPVSMIDIMICHEEEAELVAKAHELGDSKELLKWIGRNWSNQEHGDDLPVTPEGFISIEEIKLRDKNKEHRDG